MRLQKLKESVAKQLPSNSVKDILNAKKNNVDLRDFIGSNLDELGMVDKLSNFIDREYAMDAFYKSIEKDGLNKDGTVADTMLKLNSKLKPSDKILEQDDLYNLGDKDFSEYLNLYVDNRDVTFFGKNKKLLPIDKYKEQIDKFNDRKNADEFGKKLSHQDEVEYANEFIEKNDSLKRHTGAKDLIVDSITVKGPSTKDNLFLTYMSNLPFDIVDDNYASNLKYVYEAYLKGNIDLKHPYLNNESLYDRGFDDFRQTVNAFETVYDKKKLASYLKDTSVANVSEFMDGNKIKSAKDILMIVDSWAVDNEYSQEERANTQKVRLSEKELKKIKERFSNKGSREDIEKKYPQVKEDGTVIWAPTVSSEDNKISDYLDGGKFWIYKNGKWEEYTSRAAKNVLSGLANNGAETKKNDQENTQTNKREKRYIRRK